MLADNDASGERVEMAATAAAVVARHASSHIFMSAKPMFERLVGRQRATEAVPVQRPCHGEVEDGLQNADHFGALQHLRDLALTVDIGGIAERRGADRRLPRRIAHGRTA